MNSVIELTYRIIEHLADNIEYIKIRTWLSLKLCNFLA